MNDCNELCLGKKGCTGNVITACNCGDTIIFLCQVCESNHVLEPKTHLFLLPDKARKFLTRSKSSSKYEESYTKYLKVKRDVQNYIDKLNGFKESIYSFKDQIIQHLESVVQSRINHIDSLITQSHFKLTEIDERMESCNRADRKFIRRCRRKGMEFLIEDYVEVVSLNKDIISNALQEMITLYSYDPDPSEQTPIQALPTETLPNRILACRNKSKELISYDQDLNTISSYSLSSQILHNFNGSSSCILPNGSVLIAGGYNESTKKSFGNTYLIDISQTPPLCKKLSDMNFPRCWSKLLYHKDTVYSFGGYDTNYTSTAEKMSIGSNDWKPLPNMKEARYVCGTHIDRNRIYLIGGYSNTTIEYYDIIENSFEIVRNVDIPAGHVVCGEIDGKIYTIGNSHLIVYSKEFEVLEKIGNFGNNAYHYCISDIVVKESKMIYMNNSKSVIYGFDAQNKAIVELKQF